ncbi:hypothetical protein HK405_010775, partial [Cladochytrium tenue]
MMAAVPVSTAPTAAPDPASLMQARNYHSRRPPPPVAEGGAVTAADTIDDVSGWWWPDSVPARVADGMFCDDEQSDSDDDEQYSRDDLYASALAAAPMPGASSGADLLRARPYTHQPHGHLSLYDRLLHLPHPRVPTATVGNLETNIPSSSYAGVRNHLHRPSLPSRLNHLHHLELHLPSPTLTLPPRTTDSASLAAAAAAASSLSSPLLSSPSSFLDALQRQPLLLPPDSDAAAAAVAAATRAFNATVFASASASSSAAASSPHHVLHAHLSARQLSHTAPYHSSLTTGADGATSQRRTPPHRRRQQRPPAPPQPQPPPPPQQAAPPAWRKPAASDSNIYQPVARLPPHFLLAAAAAASRVVSTATLSLNGDVNFMQESDASPVPVPEVHQKPQQRDKPSGRAGAPARAPRRQASARAPTSLRSSAAGTVAATRATSPPPQTRNPHRRRRPQVHTSAPSLVLPDLAVQPATPTATTAGTESSVTAVVASATDTIPGASLPLPPQQQRDLPSVDQTPNRFLESCSLLLDDELNPFDHCFAEAAEEADATSPAGDTASIHEPAARTSASPQSPLPAPELPLVDGRVSEASTVSVEPSSARTAPLVVPPPPSRRSASAAAASIPSTHPATSVGAAAAAATSPSCRPATVLSAPNSRKRSRASSAASAVVDVADEPMSPHSAQGAVCAGRPAFSRGRSATVSTASTPKPEPADSKSTLLHEVTHVAPTPATKRRRTASSRPAAPKHIPAAVHDLDAQPHQRQRGRKSAKSQPRQSISTAVAAATPARRRRASAADGTRPIGDGAADYDEDDDDTEVDGGQGGDDDDGDEEFRPRSAGR